MEINRRLFRFENRLNALQNSIAAHDNDQSLSCNEQFIVERALMQLQTEWELFVRNLILDSSLGKYTINSKLIKSTTVISLANRESASHYLISLYPKRNKEPDWYLPNDAIRAAQLLSVSNFSNISAQLGLTPWVLDDLRYVRNFIAHKSKSSAIKLRNQNLIISQDPITAVKCAFAYNKNGIKNYIAWVQFIKFVSKSLAA